MFSTSIEISLYTRIPQRSVRYYLNKMLYFGIINADGKQNSPDRKNRINEKSANILGKKMH